ncbi:MAG TPA: hypothetical protein VIH93_06265 [Thermoanaerobaculia bacterium]|jgi:hypothetical protein
MNGRPNMNGEAGPPPAPVSGSGRLGQLEAVLAGLFLAAWLVVVLAWFRLVPLAGHLPLSLYGFFSFASALGWAAGTLYVQRGRKLPEGGRGLLRWVYYLGPQGLAYLLRAMATLQDQQAAPFVPVWALGVYSIFFLVPVAVIRW